MTENPINPFLSPNTEKAVIGAALIDKDAARQVANLPDGTFAEQKNIAAHAAIRALVAEGKEDLDYLSVETKARENGSDLDALYLMDCPEYCPSVSNLPQHIRILTSCALRRRLNATAKELMERSQDSAQTPDEIREWCARQLQEIRTSDSDRIISMNEAAMATYAAMQEAMKPDAAGKKIYSGISPLDNVLGGFRKSQMIVVGARPSVGKSILALTFCLSAARDGKRVLLISLEMNETEITERVLANMADVPLQEITSGKFTGDNLVHIGSEIGRVSRLPLWYCLEANTVERVRKAAYRLYENGGLDMLAVDYMQLMEATYARKQGRQEQVAEISRGLRKLSQELNIPVIVLTQLNRSGESTVKGVKVRREPTMSDARESGAIEQDANVFLLLHDPDRDEMKSDYERTTWDSMHEKGWKLLRLIVDKNRQGECARLLVAFDGAHMRFLPIEYRR